MAPLEDAVRSLDEPTASLVRPALAWMRSTGGAATPEPGLLRRFLTALLPTGGYGEGRVQHDVAWALGDLFEQAGLPDLAGIARAPATHEALAVRRWTASFTDVPPAFWASALAATEGGRPVPARAALSLSSAHALLQVVGDGLGLTDSGQLPLDVVRALDDRFRWTEEFPWMRVSEESDIAPLRLLRAHLVAQRLLVEDGGRLRLTEHGRSCTLSTPRLWRAVVDPAPRWPQVFEREALGVLAASVLRTADFSLGRIAEEMTHVLASRWRAVSPAHRGGVFDGAAAVAQAWYQLGVPLGWWDTGRGPADRRPNPFGRAAAVTVFWSVALAPDGLREPDGARPG